MSLSYLKKTGKYENKSIKIEDDTVLLRGNSWIFAN
jgi:hypothetical protein